MKQPFKVVHQLPDTASWTIFWSHHTAMAWRFNGGVSWTATSSTHGVSDWRMLSQESSLLANIWISISMDFEGNPQKKCTVLSKRIPRTFPNPWSFHHVNDGIKDLGKGFTKERGAIQKWEHHFIHQSWFFIFTQTFWMNSKLTTSSKIILELDRNPKKPSTSIQFTHRKRALRPKKSVMRLLLRWGLQ